MTEPRDECRPVTLPSGETIPVLGARELSPAGVAALGELVESGRRKAAQNPPDPDAAELWARIDTARRTAGLSLREVSALTGVRFAVLFRTMQGRMPDAGDLAAVEAWLAAQEAPSRQPRTEKTIRRSTSTESRLP